MRVCTEAGEDLPETAQDLSRQLHEPVNSRKPRIYQKPIFFWGERDVGCTSLHISRPIDLDHENAAGSASGASTPYPFLITAW